MFRHDVGEDAAAHVELGSETHKARLGGSDQVIQDTVGDILVEMAFVAERPDVELEAFQFDALLISDIVKDERGKIWLAGLGTQAGELRDFHMDMVIAPRIGVGKSLQGFSRLAAHFEVFSNSVRIERIISPTHYVFSLVQIASIPH
jgi:hypothetical protein